MALGLVHYHRLDETALGLKCARLWTTECLRQNLATHTSNLMPTMRTSQILEALKVVLLHQRLLWLLPKLLQQNEMAIGQAQLGPRECVNGKTSHPQ